MKKNKREKKGLWQKFVYQIDFLIAHKIQSLILFLLLLAVIISFITSIILLLADTDRSFFSDFWRFFLKTIGDDISGEPGLLYNILYFIIVIVSLLFSSVLIGIITQYIQQRVEEMRKGHSKIIEENHIIILGWAPKVHTIIKELQEKVKEKTYIEKTKQPKEKIVILDDKSKSVMEEDLVRHGKSNSKYIKTICRTGDASEQKILEILNIDDAKAIIVISTDPAYPDVKPIKTLLALKGYEQKQRKEGKEIDILSKTFVEIQKKINVKTAKIISPKSKIIEINKITAKIIAQTARQHGLPPIYEELLNYKFNEIYVTQEITEYCNCSLPIKYRDILLEFNNVSIIGFVRDGKIILNPENDKIIRKNDKLIIITRSNGSLPKNYNYPKKKNENTINNTISHKSSTLIKNILILGWNHRGKTILSELNSYYLEENKLNVFISTDYSMGKKEKQELQRKNTNIDIVFPPREKYYNYDEIESNIRGNAFESIIILSDVNLDRQSSDMRNISIMHFIKDIAIKHNLTDVHIVCELLDERNEALAMGEFFKNDFVVSAKLSALFLTQISQEKELLPIFNEIFDEKGSEIYLKDIELYVSELQKEIEFGEIVAAGNRFSRQTVIGYKKYNETPVLNVEKNTKIKPNLGDKVIVLEYTNF